VFEAIYCAQDSATLEQLKELTSKRVNVELINKNKSTPDAVSREISGGLTAQCQQVMHILVIISFYNFIKKNGDLKLYISGCPKARTVFTIIRELGSTY